MGLSTKLSTIFPDLLVSGCILRNRASVLLFASRFCCWSPDLSLEYRCPCQRLAFSIRVLFSPLAFCLFMSVLSFPQSLVFLLEGCCFIEVLSFPWKLSIPKEPCLFCQSLVISVKIVSFMSEPRLFCQSPPLSVRISSLPWGSCLFL